VDYFPVSRNTLESAEWSWSLLGSHELAGMNEFQRLLLQNAAFTPPRDIVSGIPENTRTLRIPNVPHSIAEELWHIVFWQDHFLRCTRREDFLYPKHASLGWRTIDSFSASQWQELAARFELGLTQAADIAGETRLAERFSTFQEPGSGTGPLTLLELIVNLAVHNAYHLGRIVQLRQILGCWPPPSGGDAW
jgi:uncharacterized damage-inducible protein DinB